MYLISTVIVVYFISRMIIDIKSQQSMKFLVGEKEEEATAREENGQHGFWGKNRSGKLCQIPHLRMSCPEWVI